MIKGNLFTDFGRFSPVFPGQGELPWQNVKQEYGNDSISMLEGADRVRKRPGVIFGSDGLDGCEHAVFEILSNAIDEARQGHGREIILTRFRDGRIQVEDNGRGCPVDWNEKEALQLGAGLLRAVRRRQVRQRKKREL